MTVGGVIPAVPDSARIQLYGVPAHTGVPIEVADVVALREAYGARVAGVKDSGGRIEHSVALLRAVPDELTLLLKRFDALAGEVV
jgi:dihydrodipicolinate synthase/N-acetylneuraminate lyase